MTGLAGMMTLKKQQKPLLSMCWESGLNFCYSQTSPNTIAPPCPWCPGIFPTLRQPGKRINLFQSTGKSPRQIKNNFNAKAQRGRKPQSLQSKPLQEFLCALVFSFVSLR
jgi:hypothetical protein